LSVQDVSGDRLMAYIVGLD